MLPTKPKYLSTKYIITGISVQDTSNRMLILVQSLNNSSHNIVIWYEEELMSEEKKY